MEKLLTSGLTAPILLPAHPPGAPQGSSLRRVFLFKQHPRRRPGVGTDVNKGGTVTTSARSSPSGFGTRCRPDGLGGGRKDHREQAGEPEVVPPAKSGARPLAYVHFNATGQHRHERYPFLAFRHAYAVSLQHGGNIPYDFNGPVRTVPPWAAANPDSLPYRSSHSRGRASPTAALPEYCGHVSRKNVNFAVVIFRHYLNAYLGIFAEGLFHRLFSRIGNTPGNPGFQIFRELLCRFKFLAQCLGVLCIKITIKPANCDYGEPSGCAQNPQFISKWILIV